jgi:hypothetical protein
MTEISATIEIAATPERVWAVLADLASYPQWHPVFLGVSGQLAAGSRLTITTTHPVSGSTMTAKVTVRTVDPGTELRWMSKLLGLTISVRSFRLFPAGGGTLLVQAGTYRGLNVGRFPAKTIVRVQGSFEAINQAIKRRAESLQQAPG